MDGEVLKTALKTIYGVVGYSGSMMLAMIWFGIAVGSLRDERGMLNWVMLAVSMLGYVNLFLMLAIIASGNRLFGSEINAWFLRSFALVGVVFGSTFTGLYLAHKWPYRHEHKRRQDDEMP